MAYVEQKSMFLDARRFGALPSHGLASTITYAERSCTTLYGTFRLSKKDWGPVKGHAEERMDFSILCYESETLCVCDLVRLAHEVEAGS